MNTNTDKNLPIACDLTAIPLAVREQHVTSGLKVFEAAQEIQELPDGYAFRFTNQPGVFMSLANFVENERLCCPFYTFVIEIEAGGGSLWLRLTGGEGVKEFEKAILSDPNEALAKGLIHSGDDSRLEEAVAQSATTLAGILGKR